MKGANLLQELFTFLEGGYGQKLPISWEVQVPGGKAMRPSLQWTPSAFCLLDFYYLFTLWVTHQIIHISTADPDPMLDKIP